MALFDGVDSDVLGFAVERIFDVLASDGCLYARLVVDFGLLDDLLRSAREFWVAWKRPCWSFLLGRGKLLD